jgi:heme exporter protein A
VTDTVAIAPDIHLALAIQAEGLGKSFGSRKALDNVSFELPEQAFLSIFGHNGAGKTTLLRVLSTLARPSAGKVEVLGLDVREKPEELRSRIGLISHRSMLYPDLTAEENLLFTARMYGVQNPKARVSELLELVELTARRHDPVRGFSRGMTQRIAIARALVPDPALLFLDEPYSGLDPHAVEILDRLLERLRFGKNLVMISHDLNHGFALATHLLVLAQGKVALFTERDELDVRSFREFYRNSVGAGGI